MPPVDVAMAQSLRRGFLDLFVASLQPAIQRRSLTDQINDVSTAFSSWDNCMLVDYCKWPVISLIAIAGCIIIGVIWCIIRCACCGLSCCCSCFSCLKCCGDCCGCCDPPRGSRRKYLDEPYIPPNHGDAYKSHEPMHAGFGPPAAAGAPAKKQPDYPQYAIFESSSKKDDDALPAMPSWETAEQTKVIVEEEGVEMNALKKPEAGAAAAGAAAGAAMGASGARSPTGSRSPVPPSPGHHSPAPRSPGLRSPYGAPDQGPGPGGYFPANGMDRNDPYAQGAPSYNQPAMGYNQAGRGYGVGPGRQPQRDYADDPYNDIYDAYGDNTDGYGSNATGYGSNTAGYGNSSNAGYGNNATGYGSSTTGYGNSASGYGASSDYTAPARMPEPYDTYAASNKTPYPDDYNNNSNSNPYSQSSQGYGTASQQSPHAAPAAVAAGYGMPRHGTPSNDTRRSPAPQGGAYGGSGSASGNGYGAARGPSPRGYSPSPGPGATSPSNAGYGYGDSNGSAAAVGGFDFSAGAYSRPPTARKNTGGGGGGPYPGSGQGGRGGNAGGGGYSGYRGY